MGLNMNVYGVKGERLENQNTLIRHAVGTPPELLQQAAAKISSGFIRERLMDADPVKDAYAAGAGSPVILTVFSPKASVPI